MIFFVTKAERKLVLILSESDVADKLRPGHTVTIDAGQLAGVAVAEVAVGMLKTDEDTLAFLEKANPGQFTAANRRPPSGPDPAKGETRCKGCQGVMPFASLYEDRCIVCWAKMAKALLRLVN